MKTLSILALLGFAVLSSCDNDARYRDLNTGKKVELVKDESTGLMVDADTRKPVYIYVDTETNDTIYGRTGRVINGRVVRVGDEWKYDNDAEVSIRTSGDGNADGDYKKKVEKDGDVKIKDGDTKIKIDGETGERKVKTDD